jgi:hypothetical protein
MDLCSIATCLSIKDMNAREICADMNGTLRADCIGYSTTTVMTHLREKSFSKSMLDTDLELKIEDENFIDEAILGALEECPFSSLNQVAKIIVIPMSPVRYHLAPSLGYGIRNTRWVLHSLSPSQNKDVSR